MCALSIVCAVLFCRFDRAGKSRPVRDGKTTSIFRGDVVLIVPFCTCVDYECPCHPTKHDKGCVPCVAKNLSDGEIPSCFYRKIDPEMSRDQDYSAEGFARFVMEHRKKDEA